MHISHLYTAQVTVMCIVMLITVKFYFFCRTK